MFRLAVIFIVSCFLLCGKLAAQPVQEAHSVTVAQSDDVSRPDSTALVALDAKLTEYLSALEREPVQVKCEEADFLVSTCRDSIVRQRVANKIYEHFLLSKVMGDEAVAIHVFDKWFAGGAVKMYSNEDFQAADFHARLNRPSLIGSQAPALELLNDADEPVTIPDQNSRYRILYFYDTDCSKCLVESILLRNLLEACNYPVDLYAVYSGSERDRWTEYRRSQLEIKAAKTHVFHFWDPELTSDFILKYAVISTPKMLLVDPQGIIVGRDLDSDALSRLLNPIFAPRILDYGGDEAMEMYSTVFSGADLDCGSVSEVAEHISRKTLPSGDTLTYKQMVGDLLYFLTNRKEAQFKCGANDFVDGYILGRNDIWNTADDSLKVVNLASFLKYLTSLCPLGEKMPAIEVPVTVTKRNGTVKTTVLRLDKARSAAVIFHTEGCPVCKAEIEAAGTMLTSGDRSPQTSGTGTALNSPKQLILIDMDEIWSSNDDTAEQLMKYFDISSLPFILTVDGKGRVDHKYVTFRSSVQISAENS